MKFINTTAMRRAVVLRHRVTGAIKHSFYPDMLDAMWELVLGDGSVETQGAEVMRNAEMQQRNKRQSRSA